MSCALNDLSESGERRWTQHYLGYIPPRWCIQGQSPKSNVGLKLSCQSKKSQSPRRRTFLPRVLGLFLLQFFSPARGHSQIAQQEKPVPILSGTAGFLPSITAGQTLLDTQFNPVLLVPIKERWLVEVRGEFEGAFQRAPGGGSFGGPVEKHLDYLQADYIANPYVTVTAGRFLTPFGIFNERLYPMWIRALQPDPLILPIATASSDGAMLRGGFPVSAHVNVNYAVYGSVASIGVEGVESERHVGGRGGLFFSGPRLEVGGSWQKVLQDDRKNGIGFHMAWQPRALPLSVHSEFVRSNQGSGYWMEGAYRLSQAHFWERAMRHTELVAREQQFFSGNISPDTAESLGLPGVNTKETDFGVNYFLKDGLKAVASYGRQLSSAGNFNQWTVGIAYRFLIPLGRGDNP
jgi:hypothetical protein